MTRPATALLPTPPIPVRTTPACRRPGPRAASQGRRAAPAAARSGRRGGAAAPGPATAYTGRRSERLLVGGEIGKRRTSCRPDMSAAVAYSGCVSSGGRRADRSGRAGRSSSCGLGERTARERGLAARQVLVERDVASSVA